MFPDVEIVRSVQEELDLVIEEGVANIVQLLKNADSGVSSGAARVPDEDEFEAKNRKKKDHKRWRHQSVSADNQSQLEKEIIMQRVVNEIDQPPSINEPLSST